jgi:hypothetical protein
VAATLNNLAVLLHVQGRRSEAEPLYLRALAIRERVLGPGHPSTLGTLASLAALYDAEGRHDEAEALRVRAVASGRQSSR